jgi:hypothetical protein
MLIIGFLSGSFLGQQMQFVELAPSWICSLTGDYTDAFPCITNANHVDKDDKTFNVCTLPEE